MARQRKKKGRPVSGWVILDKPEGLGSTEAVSKIKWLFDASKAGHAGTLDPLASGMLPIALGEATKTVPYVMEGAKVYHFTVAWGEQRSTDDREGEIIERSDKRPSREEIEAILPDYTGLIEQVPPQFSAIKIAGERAYDIARSGEAIEIPARTVEIERLELVGMPDDDHAEFEIECGKGTYVRSLARDFGLDLGCFGYVSSLRRTEVLPFEAEDLVTLDELIAASPREDGDVAKPALDDESVQVHDDPFGHIDSHLIETGAALESLPHVALNDEAAMRVRLGNPVIIRGRDAPPEAEEAYVTARGKLVSIGCIEAGQFKPKRVFGNS